jgi:hypothetical protein
VSERQQAGDRLESAAASSADVVPPWDRRTDGRLLLVLFLVVWVIYLATATYTSFQVNDNRATALSAWSLATRGTLALPSEWAGEIPWETPGVDGSLYTDRFPGTILVSTPAYVVAAALSEADQPSHPVFLNFVPAGLTAATVAALAVGAMFAVFRRQAGRTTAAVAAVVFAFGTASWSVSADSLWTHGLTSLGLALGMLALATDRHAAAGAAFAVSILARPQTAVVPAIVGVWRGVQQRQVRPALAIGLTSVLGVLALSLYTRLLFGSWLPVAGYNPGKVEAVLTSSAQDFLIRLGFTLIHPQRGMLLYTPFLLILLPFVHRGWRIAPSWVRSSALAGVAYLVVQLRSNIWHGGLGYFGSRLTIETLVLAAPLLLCVWQAAIAHDRVLKRLFTVLAVLALTMHAVGATVLAVAPNDAARHQTYLEELCDESDGSAPPECAARDLEP